MITLPTLAYPFKKIVAYPNMNFCPIFLTRLKIVIYFISEKRKTGNAHGRQNHRDNV